ncbi:unnamed protein product [Owenia fusiformis]|uniref:Uncharacterized protein n=1 Tax=Owenia fusiformis TaxID=6347 RepID=A0A8J1TI14_OWEFU|nr:unnamed protein product [Owenia fusiformis]
MTSETGLDYIIENKEFIKKLATALDTDAVPVKKQVFELLSALCVYSPDGYTRALDALQHYKETKKTRYRFSLISDELNQAKVTAYKSTLVALINCIIISTDNIEERIRIRNEFIGLKLLEIIQRLRDDSTEDEGKADLLVQLDVFEEEKANDDEQLPGPIGVDLSSHIDVFNAIYKQVCEGQHEAQFLAILQHLLQTDFTDPISTVIWDTIEKLVYGATLMEKKEDAETVKILGEKKLEKAIKEFKGACTCNCHKSESKSNEGSSTVTSQPPPPAPPPPTLSGAPVPPPPPPTPGGAPPPPPPFGAPPPPPPFGGAPPPPSMTNTKPQVKLPQQKIPCPKSKMRKLQWNKIPVNKVLGKNNVWTKAGERFNGYTVDYDSMENLFSLKQQNSESKAVDKTDGNTEKRKKDSTINLLDGKKNLNVNIFLRQFRLSNEEIIQLLVNSQSEQFGAEKLRGLLKVLPEPDEVEMLRSFDGDKNKLGSAEKFFLQLLNIPNYKLRIEAMLIKEEFKMNMDWIKPSMDAIILTAKDIKDSTMLQEILYLVLIAGNFLNAGGYSGDAAGFKLASLLRLTETRANKPRMTLMHYVVMQAEKKNPKLLDFSQPLKYLKDASLVSFDNLTTEISGLDTKVTSIADQLNQTSPEFQAQMQDFLKYAKSEMHELQEDLKEMEELRVELADFFCEDTSTFKLEECLKTLQTFCLKFKKAIEENKQRRVAEEKAEQRKKLQEEKEKKRHSGDVGTQEKKRPTSGNSLEEDGSIVDKLLGDIRSGFTNKKLGDTNFSVEKVKAVNLDSPAPSGDSTPEGDFNRFGPLRNSGRRGNKLAHRLRAIEEQNGTDDSPRSGSNRSSLVETDSDGMGSGEHPVEKPKRYRKKNPSDNDLLDFLLQNEDEDEHEQFSLEKQWSMRRKRQSRKGGSNALSEFIDRERATSPSPLTLGENKPVKSTSPPSTLERGSTERRSWRNRFEKGELDQVSSGGDLHESRAHRESKAQSVDRERGNKSSNSDNDNKPSERWRSRRRYSDMDQLEKDSKIMISKTNAMEDIRKVKERFEGVKDKEEKTDEVDNSRPVSRQSSTLSDEVFKSPVVHEKSIDSSVNNMNAKLNNENDRRTKALAKCTSSITSNNLTSVLDNIDSRKDTEIKDIDSKVSSEERRLKLQKQYSVSKDSVAALIQNVEVKQNDKQMEIPSKTTDSNANATKPNWSSDIDRTINSIQRTGKEIERMVTVEPEKTEAELKAEQEQKEKEAAERKARLKGSLTFDGADDEEGGFFLRTGSLRRKYVDIDESPSTKTQKALFDHSSGSWRRDLDNKAAGDALEVNDEHEHTKSHTRPLSARMSYYDNVPTPIEEEENGSKSSESTPKLTRSVIGDTSMDTSIKEPSRLQRSYSMRLRGSDKSSDTNLARDPRRWGRYYGDVNLDNKEEPSLKRNQSAVEIKSYRKFEDSPDLTNGSTDDAPSSNHKNGKKEYNSETDKPSRKDNRRWSSVIDSNDIKSVAQKYDDKNFSAETSDFLAKMRARKAKQKEILQQESTSSESTKYSSDSVKRRNHPNDSTRPMSDESLPRSDSTNENDRDEGFETQSETVSQRTSMSSTLSADLTGTPTLKRKGIRSPEPTVIETDEDTRTKLAISLEKLHKPTISEWKTENDDDYDSVADESERADAPTTNDFPGLKLNDAWAVAMRASESDTSANAEDSSTTWTEINTSSKVHELPETIQKQIKSPASEKKIKKQIVNPTRHGTSTSTHNSKAVSQKEKHQPQQALVHPSFRRGGSLRKPALDTGIKKKATSKTADAVTARLAGTKHHSGSNSSLASNISTSSTSTNLSRRDVTRRSLPARSTPAPRGHAKVSKEPTFSPSPSKTSVKSPETTPFQRAGSIRKSTTTRPNVRASLLAPTASSASKEATQSKTSTVKSNNPQNKGSNRVSPAPGKSQRGPPKVTHHTTPGVHAPPHRVQSPTPTSQKMTDIAANGPRLGVVAPMRKTTNPNNKSLHTSKDEDLLLKKPKRPNSISVAQNQSPKSKPSQQVDENHDMKGTNVKRSPSFLKKFGIGIGKVDKSGVRKSELNKGDVSAVSPDRQRKPILV